MSNVNLYTKMTQNITLIIKENLNIIYKTTVKTKNAMYTSLKMFNGNMFLMKLEKKPQSTLH